MLNDLSIRLAPERLAEGDAEERAAFGLFTISSNTTMLTEGFDYFINSNRPGPLVSGYHVAEWFAWNWWRLISEGRSAASDWMSAHSMTSIGEGYVWPNIKVFSDGFRTTLLSDPSSNPDAKPFRYIGAAPVAIPSTTFEAAVDIFVASIQARLRDESIPETNLDRLWRDIAFERQDPEIAKRRRLEALLGSEPDSESNAAVDQLLEDSKAFGESVAGELAADNAQRRERPPIVTAEQLHQIAADQGFDGAPNDSVRLTDHRSLSQTSAVPAWRLGVDAARAIRAQEHLGEEHLSSTRLAEMTGISKGAIDSELRHVPLFSFALDTSKNESRVVFRSRWATGRRFEVARLLGDRLFADDDILYPATRASTYRQKAQRAFAAELLSPFAVVDALADGDYSDEHLQEIADHFEVSPLTISTLLKNHGRLPRDIYEYATAI